MSKRPLHNEAGKLIGYLEDDEVLTVHGRISKLRWFNTRGRSILNKHHLARVHATMRLSE